MPYSGTIDCWRKVRTAPSLAPYLSQMADRDDTETVAISDMTYATVMETA